MTKFVLHVLKEQHCVSSGSTHNRQIKKWINEIKEVMKELQIKIEDLKVKTKKHQICLLRDKFNKIKIMINTQKSGRVISDERRKLQSGRMKRYWDRRKQKTRKQRNPYY